MNRLGTIQPETSENLDINLSPLIDMVFLLLIFFMVTTVFVDESAVGVEKPSAVSAEQLERRTIMLQLRPDGSLSYGREPLRLNGVRGLVARQLRDGDRPVVIVADAAVPTGLLVDVIDECKLGGAARVSVAAEKETP